jgi:hypothetical protein
VDIGSIPVRASIHQYIDLIGFISITLSIKSDFCPVE